MKLVFTRMTVPVLAELRVNRHALLCKLSVNRIWAHTVPFCSSRKTIVAIARPGSAHCLLTSTNPAFAEQAPSVQPRAFVGPMAQDTAELLAPIEQGEPGPVLACLAIR